MAGREIHLELLLGRKVIAKNGKSIGRIEEIRAVRRGRQLLIEEYLVGNYAMLERLSAFSIARALIKQFNARRGGFRVRWDKLDVSDYEPRLKCTLDELEPINDGEHQEGQEPVVARSKRSSARQG